MPCLPSIKTTIKQLDNMVNETKEELSQKQLYNFNKLQKRLRHAAGKAIADFNMIEDGDRVMVCMSGGKDSYALLEILQSLKRSAPVDFELIPVHLNGMFPKYPEGIVENYLKGTGLEYHVIKENIHDIIIDKIPDGKNICSLCSRLRRGILYRTARELGITKIALGHHADDILATFFLNLFYAGKLKSMPPKLLTDDGDNIVIRPLAYCREKDLIRLAEIRNYPILSKDICSLGENKMRKEIEEMIRNWDRQYHGRSEIMFKALKDICLSHLLDTTKYDFNLKAERKSED
ncbi:tRNA 2-thiocytidine biosynthesis protein TtcA [Ruminobacter amylophilus]|uniref:tRNA-cytidine(32) 2-sulfurtransferase n=2 Tax=Succinivibrionaceae TaxID=83763 RepID=A0A662ZGY8_9GAMM|nr:tRNA 2-thiocytidine biosynthesis protein TtcA [Ruminobacter amylophilus]